MASVGEWVATNGQPRTPPSDDSEDKESPDDFLSTARRDVLTSRTSTRVEFLEKRLLPWARKEARDDDQTLEIVGQLTLTVARYADKRSRQAVLAVVEALVRSDARDQEKEARPVFESLVRWLAADTQRSSQSGYETDKLSECTTLIFWLRFCGRLRAASTRFSLLCWITFIFRVAADAFPDFSSTGQWTQLVESWASLLDTLYDTSNGAKATTSRAAKRISLSTVDKVGLR
jgi:hypothetical protein